MFPKPRLVVLTWWRPDRVSRLPSLGPARASRPAWPPRSRGEACRPGSAPCNTRWGWGRDPSPSSRSEEPLPSCSAASTPAASAWKDSEIYQYFGILQYRVLTPMDNMSKNKPSTSMTRIDCESQPHSVVSSSMPNKLGGNRVPGRVLCPACPCIILCRN